MNKLQIAITLALVFSITSLIVTIAAAYAESNDDGDGLCSHYFRTGYQEAGEKCLEEQERAKEKKECEKDGKKDC